MCGCDKPKQCFVAMAYDCKPHTMILWPVISIKLNIDKKIAGIEITALNHEKVQHVFKLIELMFKEELHCLHNGFLQMESQLNMKLQMNYLQKDN